MNEYNFYHGKVKSETNVNFFFHPHNDRKETNIHEVQKTLIKIKSPNGNCLEAHPKSMDEIKYTWVTIKRSKTMDQIIKKRG